MRLVNNNLKFNYNIANLITLIKILMIYIHVQKQGVFTIGPMKSNLTVLWPNLFDYIYRFCNDTKILLASIGYGINCCDTVYCLKKKLLNLQFSALKCSILTNLIIISCFIKMV